MSPPRRCRLPRISLLFFLLLMIPVGVGLVGLRHYLHSRPLAWEPYSARALDEYRGEGRTILVNFRVGDIVCVYHEHTALDTLAMRRAVRSRGVVAMMADCTDESPEVMRALDSLGRSAVPVVAIYSGSSDDPLLLADMITEKEILAALAAAAER